MSVLAYLGSQFTQFHTAGWMYWFFTSFSFELCTWPEAISRWIQQKNSITFCANLRKSATETLGMIRQVPGEERKSSTRVFEWHPQFTADRKRRLSFSLTSRGLFTKHLSWRKAKQSILHTTVMFYSDWVKTCDDFTQNFAEKNSWMLHHNNAPFHTSFSTK
jgi:hypothetical protein